MVTVSDQDCFVNHNPHQCPQITSPSIFFHLSPEKRALTAAITGPAISRVDWSGQTTTADHVCSPVQWKYR